MRLLLALLLLGALALPAAASPINVGTLTCEQLMETVWCVLAFSGDTNATATVALYSKDSIGGDWLEGVQMDRLITDNTASRYGGGTFFLSPSTQYSFKSIATDNNGCTASCESNTVTLTTWDPTPATPVTSGDDYYVDGSLGDDGNDCTASGASACATIQGALDKAGIGPGDTINIANGTYYETITFNDSGTAGNPITLIGESEAGVIISGAQPEWDGLSWSLAGTGPPDWQTDCSAEGVVGYSSGQQEIYVANADCDPDGSTACAFTDVHTTTNTRPVMVYVDDVRLYAYAENGGQEALKDGVPRTAGGIDESDKCRLLPGFIFDHSAGKFYLRGPAGVNPNTAKVEGSYRRVGISTGEQDHITIQNLTVDLINRMGIHVTQESDYIRIQGVSITRSFWGLVYGDGTAITNLIVNDLNVDYKGGTWDWQCRNWNCFNGEQFAYGKAHAEVEEFGVYCFGPGTRELISMTDVDITGPFNALAVGAETNAIESSCSKSEFNRINMYENFDNAIELDGSGFLVVTLDTYMTKQGSAPISVQPITFGPAWILYSTVDLFNKVCVKKHNGRSGHLHIYHATCYPDLEDWNTLEQTASSSAAISMTFGAANFDVRNTVLDHEWTTLKMSNTGIGRCSNESGSPGPSEPTCVTNSDCDSGETCCPIDQGMDCYNVAINDGGMQMASDNSVVMTNNMFGARPGTVFDAPGLGDAKTFGPLTYCNTPADPGPPVITQAQLCSTSDTATFHHKHWSIDEYDGSSNCIGHPGIRSQWMGICSTGPTPSYEGIPTYVSETQESRDLRPTHASLIDTGVVLPGINAYLQDSSRNYEDDGPEIGAWEIRATPSEVCGNNIVEGGEDCDDGGVVNGDCCNSVCEYEASASSCSDGLYCTTPDTCDGAGTCDLSARDCDDSDVCTNDSCDEVGDACAYVRCTTNHASCSVTGIAYDAATTDKTLDTSGDRIDSYSHTEGGSLTDGVALVWVVGKRSPGQDADDCIVTGVTYAGDAMTLEASASAVGTGGLAAKAFAFSRPLGTRASQSSTVEITWAGPCEIPVSGTMTLTGVDQTMPVSGFGSSTAGTLGAAVSALSTTMTGLTTGQVLATGFASDATTDVAAVDVCDLVERAESFGTAGYALDLATLEVDAASEDVDWITSNPQYRLLQIILALVEAGEAPVAPNIKTVDGGSGNINQ